MKNLKRLIDPVTGVWVTEFQANGKNYYIRSPKDGLGLFRHMKLKQLMISIYANRRLPDIISSLVLLKKKLNTLVTKEPELDQVFEIVEGLYQAMRDEANRRYEPSLLAATTFIYTKNEDMETWDEQIAQEKIEDWCKEGIYELDFFPLSLSWATYELEAQAKALSLVQRAARALGYGDQSY